MLFHMSDIKKRIAKLDTEIAVAKTTKQKHKARARIVRSFKGDPSTHDALVKTTGLGIDASKAQRDILSDDLKAEQNSSRKTAKTGLN